MDKELLRIVIVALGITVCILMLLWAVFKRKKGSRRDILDDHTIDESLIVKPDDDFDLEVVPLGSALDDDDDPLMRPSPVSADIPAIIQLSLMSGDKAGFNGTALVKAFDLVGLEYGSNQIFERLDEIRRVDFAVGSLVGPGTFPNDGLDDFYSSGIVFYIQPKELDNPLMIFDEFVETIKLLETNLGGQIIDHKKQLLSEETIQQFRLQMQ